MALDVEAVGAVSAEHRLSYDWKTLVLYALGIGAKREELDYLYEGRGPKVYPTFAVVPTYPVLSDLLEKSKASLERAVHMGQSITVHAQLPPTPGELVTSGEVTGIYDLKRMAQMTFSTTTTLDGQLIYTTEWSMLFLDDGGFGGPRPPKSTLVKVPPHTPPLFQVEELIPAEQALLYRLSGDLNPLHADDAVAHHAGFERGPILHGLATYGYCARALIHSQLGGDASRLKAFHAQFRKPVWPGEKLLTTGYRVDGTYSLKASAGGRDDEVAVLCSAEVAEPSVNAPTS